MHLLLESWIGRTMHWYVIDELDRWDNAFVIGELDRWNNALVR